MEFRIIEQYFKSVFSGDSGERVTVGIGDDAAILSCRPGYELVVAVDTLNAGVHFPHDCPAEWVASRALRSNLSDLAACGAEAFAFTLAISLPKELAIEQSKWLKAFSCQLALDSRDYGIGLVGGDTTQGPLCVTIQVLGEVPAGEALLRSGARPGDTVYVTGTLGDAAAWLDDTSDLHFTRRFAFPEPRIDFSCALRGLATSCIDLSDGLVADLAHICRASSVSATVEIEQLPLSAALQEKPGCMEYALAGGDDYELCFTCPASASQALEALARQYKLDVTAIGRIADGEPEVKLTRHGQQTKIPARAYEHFS